MKKKTPQRGEAVDVRYFDQEAFTRQALEANDVLDELGIAKADDVGKPFTVAERIRLLAKQDLFTHSLVFNCCQGGDIKQIERVVYETIERVMSEL